MMSKIIMPFRGSIATIFLLVCLSGVEKAQVESEHQVSMPDPPISYLVGQMKNVSSIVRENQQKGVAIVGYIGEEQRLALTFEKMVFARNYLISYLQIPEPRVTLILGGNRSQVMVDVFAVDFPADKGVNRRRPCPDSEATPGRRFINAAKMVRELGFSLEPKGSKRSDVEKFLGYPVDGLKGTFSVYETSHGLFAVSYRMPPKVANSLSVNQHCSSDILDSILFFPLKLEPIELFEISHKELVETKAPGRPEGWFLLATRDGKFRFEVIRGGKTLDLVYSIEFFPS